MTIEKEQKYWKIPSTGTTGTFPELLERLGYKFEEETSPKDSDRKKKTINFNGREIGDYFTDETYVVNLEEFLNNEDMQYLDGALELVSLLSLNGQRFEEVGLAEVTSYLREKTERLEQLRRPGTLEKQVAGEPASLKLSEVNWANEGLSVRARSCLGKLNIKTYEELATKTQAELDAVKNVGKRIIFELRRKLKYKGLDLRYT